MSIVSGGPDAQDSLFSDHNRSQDNVPQSLARASLRLDFPPSYVVVGVYRLFTDKALYVPAWDKCRHATQRGAVVGLAWTVLTFRIQKKFVEIFLSNSPRVTGLANETLFGHPIPFKLSTYAAVLFLGSQVTLILRFFLSHNMRIARERAWAQTVASRGKGPEFWQPYVEEWDNPPYVSDSGGLDAFLGNGFVRFLIQRVLLFPFTFYPLVGIAISAWLRALGTARYLHKPYFESKKMTKHQQAVFVEERKWDYRIFGFAATLLEGLPIIGLVFSISNRVGAAMWAHDLEKRQHFIATQRHGSSATLK